MADPGAGRLLLTHSDQKKGPAMETIRLRQSPATSQGGPSIPGHGLTDCARVAKRAAGCALSACAPGPLKALLDNFASTSAGVASGTPGNKGYFFGRAMEGRGDTVLFVSLWQDLAAVKARFGDDWQVSYIPDGYDDLVEDYRVRQFDMSGGWHPESF
ncbi:MAG: hypothetical protein JJ899_07005 [Alphaproteobacteria bacterium]|nr:hypothetical protein [Alphaproteobacteria bacterium]